MIAAPSFEEKIPILLISARFSYSALLYEPSAKYWTDGLTTVMANLKKKTDSDQNTTYLIFLRAFYLMNSNGTLGVGLLSSVPLDPALHRHSAWRLVLSGNKSGIEKRGGRAD